MNVVCLWRKRERHARVRTKCSSRVSNVYLLHVRQCKNETKALNYNRQYTKGRKIRDILLWQSSSSKKRALSVEVISSLMMEKSWTDKNRSLHEKDPWNVSVKNVTLHHLGFQWQKHQIMMKGQCKKIHSLNKESFRSHSVTTIFLPSARRHSNLVWHSCKRSFKLSLFLD